MTDTDTRPRDDRSAASRPPQPGRRLSGPFAGLTTTGVLVKVVGLGLVIAVAFALTPALLAGERWLGLAALWATTAALLAVYSTKRLMPLKYLLPGTIFLLAFLVYPIVATIQLSFTNFGDGTRSSKEEAIAAIVGRSVQQLPDSPRYNLSVGTTGTPTEGPFTFFLVEPESEDVFAGTAEGLEELDEGDVEVTEGFVTAADGFEILTPAQVNDASAALSEFTVPTDDGAIRQLGIRQAFEGVTTLQYDEDADTITDTQTGQVYEIQQVGDRELFVGEDGQQLSDQSWRAFVGLDNYERIFTDSRISADFLRIFAWTVVYAVASVGLSFALGLFLAVVLNDDRMRFRRTYRSLLLLPYAIPSFISLLVWASFYNREFGLINDVLGTDINWLGDRTMAKVAAVLTNLWLGFPYMFVVCTGALQAVPSDLKEAASIDGANGLTAFRRITFPLLLVAVAPLLVASFAFNFNNVNGILLLTEGGPFDPANPSAGYTDILISYTYRLAFGGSGAQFGFAAAISTLLFVLTAVIAAVQFRATRALEEVN